MLQYPKPAALALLASGLAIMTAALRRRPSMSPPMWPLSLL